MIDINLMNRMIKGIKAAEAPVKRLSAIDKRVYELSKRLPTEEGMELIKLHEESKRESLEAFSLYRKAIDEQE